MWVEALAFGMFPQGGSSSAGLAWPLATRLTEVGMWLRDAGRNISKWCVSGSGKQVFSTTAVAVKGMMTSSSEHLLGAMALREEPVDPPHCCTWVAAMFCSDLLRDHLPPSRSNNTHGFQRNVWSPDRVCHRNLRR